MRIRRMMAVGLLLAMLCGCFCGCNARQSKYGAALRFPLCAEPAQLDPQMAKDAASKEVLCAVMEGLTRLSAEGEVVPGVAEKWTVSADNKTVTFFLRDTVWSDGTPLTADDFAFAFARAADKATRSPLAGEFENIASAVATDAQTLTVTLKKPDANFPTKAASTAFYPCNRVFFEKSAGHYGMEADYLLCNGGFTLSSWSHGEYLILRKNGKYYASEEILSDAVRYVLNVDESDAVRLLETGALSACAVPSDQVAAAKRAKCTTETVHDGLYALWFNTATDALSAASTRVSLCAALDRAKLETMLNDAGAEVATGFVPPDTLYNGAPFASEGATFPALSKGKKVGNLPQLTLLCGEDDLSVALAKEILQRFQKEFSLYFKIEKLPEAELTARLRRGDFELALGTVVSTGDTVGKALAAFSSKNGGNVTGFSDTTFDRLLNEAVAADTKAAYEKAQARLFATCPCLPLSYPARTFAFGEGVQGVTVHPFGGGIYGAVYDFRQATRK